MVGNVYIIELARDLDLAKYQILWFGNVLLTQKSTDCLVELLGYRQTGEKVVHSVSVLVSCRLKDFDCNIFLNALTIYHERYGSEEVNNIRVKNSWFIFNSVRNRFLISSEVEKSINRFILRLTLLENVSQISRDLFVYLGRTISFEYILLKFSQGLIVVIESCDWMYFYKDITWQSLVQNYLVKSNQIVGIYFVGQCNIKSELQNSVMYKLPVFIQVMRWVCPAKLYLFLVYIQIKKIYVLLERTENDVLALSYTYCIPIVE